MMKEKQHDVLIYMRRKFPPFGGRKLSWHYNGSNFT